MAFRKRRYTRRPRRRRFGNRKMRRGPPRIGYRM